MNGIHLAKELYKKTQKKIASHANEKVKHPEDSSEAEWEASNTSLDKDKEQEKENAKQKIRGKELGAKRKRERVKEKEKEIDLEAARLIDKEEIIKEVLGEGLKQLKDKTDELDVQESSKSIESKNVDEEKAGEDEKEVDKVRDEEKDDEEPKEIPTDKDVLPDKEIRLDGLKVFQPETELGKGPEPVKEYILDKEIEISIEKTAEVTDDETVIGNKKQNKVLKDQEVLDLDFDKTKLLKKAKINMDSIKRSQTGLPKTVRLNKLNKEFYNERRWPDGIVRFVIKKLKEYDLEDLRNRLAEVNSILIKETCVRLHEVDEQEADGYEDSIILDTSPDYVTGRVGGKQIFGCVELFRGGQHRQHTAMMVMAMLGFYFEVSRHDRDIHIRVHNRHVRPDKLHHFEKIRDEATLDLPYDYKSATHPAWQFWRKIGKTGISTVATYKDQDPDGSIMRSLGQNERLLSESDIIKINSIYGISCFENKQALQKKKKRSKHRSRPKQ